MARVVTASRLNDLAEPAMFRVNPDDADPPSDHWFKDQDPAFDSWQLVHFVPATRPCWFISTHGILRWCTVSAMTEQDDALVDLRGNNVLAAIAWAWASTRRQTLQSYDPDTGHDQGWLGYNAFKVLVDRLNRVFSLERFKLSPIWTLRWAPTSLPKGFCPASSRGCLICARG